MGSRLRLRCQRRATQPLASRPEPRCLTIARRPRSSRIAPGGEVALSMRRLAYVGVVLADVLAHLYERRHVLDGAEVLERNLRLGLFGCCHCRVTPSAARLGCRGGGRPPYLRPGILAAFRIIIRYCMGCRERVASGGWRLSWDVKPPLVSHLVPSGCEKTQGVASSGRDKQRDTCWEACEAARGASCHVP